MLVDLATGEREDDKPEPPTPAEEFARSGGLKGGAALARCAVTRAAETALDEAGQDSDTVIPTAQAAR
jgi:hypothetical protein